MEAKATHITQKQYHVKGMSCAACASSVESMLKAQQGVSKANVNFANHSVAVAYDATAVSPGQLKQTLDKIGYELVTESVDAAEMQAEKKTTLKKLKKKLLNAAGFSLPVFVLSMFMIEIPFKNWVLLLLSIPVVFYSGRAFYVNAWKKIKHGTTNMDTLIALGTGAAFLFSLFNTFFPEYLLQFGLEPHVYYESAVVIITLILFGNYMEEKAKDRTSTAIEKLIGLQPREANLIKNGNIITVDVDEVTVDDILLIKPGAKIPLDGVVVSGNSYVDESMVTGEPEHARKKEGEKVVGGTINQTGSMEVRVNKVGEDTMLSRIIKMVQDAQGSKAPAQKLADKISSIFVPIVIAIAVVSFAIWMIAGPGFSTAFVVLVTVLIIACPCALGLATPTAITVGIGKGANNGILIKDAEALEKVKDIDVLLVDKTGTITEGKPTVEDFIVSKTCDEEELLEAIYLLEQKSEHPLAKSILDHLQDREINTGQLQLKDFQSITGEGIEGGIAESKYFIGSIARLKNNQVKVDQSIEAAFKRLERSSKTIVIVTKDNILVAAISIDDQLKANAKAAIATLHKENIKVIMVTGDNEGVAKRMADQVGIDQVYAEVLPEEKSTLVAKFQEANKKVAMAGDGINDAPALARADVGIAMGSGTDIAIESASLTLVKGDIGKIAQAIQLSRQTSRTIKENLFWAFIYNIITIPVAAGILFPFTGFLLNPMIAGGAMAFSSVSVVLNSLRLKHKKI